MTYTWQADFSASYALACRYEALRAGSARFATISEMYWLERQGLVP